MQTAHSISSPILPRAPSWPALGSLPILLREHFGALTRWQREIGSIYELPIGPSKFVLIGDPDAASEVLIDKARNFVRGGPFWKSLANLFGDGMLTSEGELWRERRRLIQPYFHTGAVRNLVAGIDGSIDEVCRGWASEPGHARVDAAHRAAQLTMAIGVRVMFNGHIDAAEYKRIADALTFAIDRIALGWVTYNLPPWLPIPGRRRYRRALTEIDRMVLDFAATRRDAKDYDHDVLGMLVSLREQGALDDKGLRDEAVSLFIAGHETTGSTLGFALWELADKPEILAALAHEADEVLGEGRVGPDDIEKVERLSYARQTFKEAMRMYPGSLWIPRIALADDSVAGLPIAAGTTVMVSIYDVHNDPRWWDEPRAFRPERHASDATPPRHPHAWLPFGLGRHMCVGQRLALVEGPLALARIAQRFTLSTVPERRPKMKISTGLDSADGIWLDMRPR
ncbi:cytochrome P450 [Nannocystaceae bacterium ST9]